MEHTLHHLYETLGDAPCLFGYAGGFPDEHTARLIELGATVLDQQGASTSERGRLGYVMVEAYQNVVRHRARLSKEQEAGVARSHFMLHCGSTGQTVGTLNPVAMDKAKDLQEVLGFLKQRTPTELKGLFRDGIQRTHEPGRRGAGLGLIEMMRRSGATPTWDRNDILDEHTLFALAWSAGIAGAPPQGLELLHMQRSRMAEANAWLSYAGLDTAEVLENLGRMVETEPGRPGDDVAGRRALHRAVELLRPPGEVAVKIALMFSGTAEKAMLRAGALLPGTSAGAVLAQIELARSEQPGMDVGSEIRPDGTWVQLSLSLQGT